MIKAILFDCDGVLIDSERPQQARNREFVETFHLDMDPRAFYILVGSSPQMSHRVWPQIYAQAHTDWTLDEFIDHWRQFRQWDNEGSDFPALLFPDVLPTLTKLNNANYRIACASSSSSEYIHTMARQCDLENYFDLMVSGRDFKESKPAPDIYLHCAAALGLRPEECLVVEDSPYGIQAALAAGMEVLARRDTEFGMDQSQATRIIDDLDGLLTYLKERDL